MDKKKCSSGSDSSDMDQEFLPPEIITKILVRLPAKTVTQCKSVCKSWLKLLEEILENPEFVKEHLSRSRFESGLITYHNVFKLYEFVDDLDLEHHHLHYNLLADFDKSIFTSTSRHGIVGSVNGLVLLWGNYHPKDLYVCNPITRRFIHLPCLDSHENSNKVIYGFGVSKMSGQYKVVRIVQELGNGALDIGYGEYIGIDVISKSECWVYTLGTGTWRSVPYHNTSYYYDAWNQSTHAFLNGNLHWLVKLNVHWEESISCLDLETELFSSFCTPPSLGGMWSDPVVLEDCLCMCDSTGREEYEILIWVMKEYGNEKSWAKLFVITKSPNLFNLPHIFSYPLKLFKDGDILMLGGPLFYYSKKTGIAQDLDFLVHDEDTGVFVNYEVVEARLHAPSFVSLTSFAMETVKRF